MSKCSCAGGVLPGATLAIVGVSVVVTEKSLSRGSISATTSQVNRSPDPLTWMSCEKLSVVSTTYEALLGSSGVSGPTSPAARARASSAGLTAYLSRSYSLCRLRNDVVEVSFDAPRPTRKIPCNPSTSCDARGPVLHG